ncbi:MAG TPA: HAD family acid phosphatase [Thermoanaerobaculia bacterium]|nr:HAD family acid phosphatase [Thermoanaerobaculia bacterium]
MNRNAILLTSLLVLTSGCATTPKPKLPVPKPPVVDSGGSQASITPALPPAVHWLSYSAEHRAIFLEVYGWATKTIEAEAKNRPRGTWAVALDADETVIDNSAYERELVERGEVYGSASWGQFVHRMDSPPLPGALEFLQRVRELGGKIAIVTNRHQELCPVTRADFDKYHIPYDVILCRPRGASARKEPRWQAVENGTAKPGMPALPILMWLGDNIEDFPGGYQSLATAPSRALEKFGRRYFVLPNPVYGSWQGPADTGGFKKKN